MQTVDTIRLIRQFEVKYFDKIQPVIQDEINHVALILEKQGFLAARKYVEGLIITKEIPQIINQLYAEVGGRFARRQWIELGKQKRAAKKTNHVPLETKGFGFNAQWVRNILNYFREHLYDKIILKIAQTTRTILLNVLNKAINEGWGIDKTVKYMRDQEQFTLSKYQAARIARTETIRAANAGIYEAGKSFPFQQTKEWIASNDNRVRGLEKHPHASHFLLNGQRIDFEDYFIDPINGDKLLYPGDPNASAASTINCRCAISIVAKVDENGRLIDKINVNEFQH